MSERKLKVIGVGGFARSGKDTFCAVASKILRTNGYGVNKLAFADELKNQVQKMLNDNLFDLDVWTDNTEEKTKIRPLLVWWGCARRELGDGLYWVDELDWLLSSYADTGGYQNTVFLVSDVRFPNEAKWLHEKWNGWFVHVKKFSVRDYEMGGLYNEPKSVKNCKVFDEAPNEEEAKQDPLIQELADDRLTLENVMEREARLGNKITVDQLVDNDYLNQEIKICLSKIPFLTIQK